MNTQDTIAAAAPEMWEMLQKASDYLGSGLAADGVMIDGVFISKERVGELLKRDKVNLFKGQCIACGGNHGGLACPQMAITCKVEG